MNWPDPVSLQRNLHSFKCLFVQFNSCLCDDIISIHTTLHGRINAAYWLSTQFFPHLFLRIYLLFIPFIIIFFFAFLYLCCCEQCVYHPQLLSKNSWKRVNVNKKNEEQKCNIYMYIIITALARCVIVQETYNVNRDEKPSSQINTIPK